MKARRNMPQILFLIPISFTIIVLISMFMVMHYVSQNETGKIIIFLIITLITGIAVPLSASFAQFKTEMTLTVHKKGEKPKIYKNVHSVNYMEHGLYQMTDRHGKTFKILVDSDKDIEKSDVHTYNQ